VGFRRGEQGLSVDWRPSRRSDESGPGCEAWTRRLLSG
jgi:hypothetical protein